MPVPGHSRLRRGVRHDESRSPTLLALLLAVAFVAVCYFARDVLLPFALAVLLSFLLAPLASRFQRWRLGRVGSVILAVILAFSVLAATGYVITRQVLDLAGNIPQYEGQLTEKIKSLRRARSPELSEVAQTIEHLDQELTKSQAEPPGDPAASDPPAAGPFEPPFPGATAPSDDPDIATDLIRAFTLRPLPVQIVDTTFMPIKLLRDASPLLSSLGSLAITVVFVLLTIRSVFSCANFQAASSVSFRVFACRAASSAVIA